MLSYKEKLITFELCLSRFENMSKYLSLDADVHFIFLNFFPNYELEFDLSNTLPFPSLPIHLIPSNNMSTNLYKYSLNFLRNIETFLSRMLLRYRQ